MISKHSNIGNVICNLIFLLFYQTNQRNIKNNIDMFCFLDMTMQEENLKKQYNNSLFMNYGNLKYFYKHLINFLYLNFYYKVEIKNEFNLAGSQQISLIIDNCKYIQEKNLRSTSPEWTLFYFLTLLDKKKDRIFLKHLFFNENYLLTFKWLYLAYSLQLFKNKM